MELFHIFTIFYVNKFDFKNTFELFSANLTIQ
jgi:hypothetical protein